MMKKPVIETVEVHFKFDSGKVVLATLEESGFWYQWGHKTETHITTPLTEALNDTFNREYRRPF